MLKYTLYFLTGSVILAILILLFLLIRLKGIQEDKHDLKGSVDKAAEAYLEKEKSYGLAIALIKDEQLYFKGFGTIQKGMQIVPNDQNLFELASVSKLFTTATAQIMADKGLIDLDAGIAAMLSDKVKLPEHAKHITIRQLATHTSGLPNIPSLLQKKMTNDQNPYKSLQTEDLYVYLRTCEEMKAPGESLYSNLGMGLLGHVLELSSGIAYEELVRLHLLDPLDMNNTLISLSSSETDFLAQGYNEAGKPAPVWTDSVLTGAGSFLSNTSDMMRFIQAHLNNTSGLSESLYKTLEPQFNTSSGMGWMLPDWLDKFLGMKNIIWHNGQSGGYSAYISINKVQKTGIIILSNKATDITNFGRKLSRILNSQSWK